MKKLLLILIPALLFASCLKDEETTQQYTFPDSRVTLKNQSIPLVSGYGLKSAAEVNYEFTLVAEVEAPSVESTTLQATHIDITGNFAYVSYNVMGSEILGAIDIIDITSPNNPVIINTILFDDKNINTIAFLNGDLIYGGSDDNGAFVAVNDTTIYIPSFSVNSLVVNDNLVYITSADIGGGLTTLDLATMEWEFVEIFDARSVCFHEIPYVLSSSAVHLPTEQISIDPGYIQDASKADIIAGGDHIIAALNRGGVYVYDIETMNVAHQIPRPLTPEGEDSEDYVSNSVSLNELLFIANGGAGILVCDALDFLELGYFDFGYNYSSNFVVSEGNFIFVATGLGGFKILTFETTVDSGWTEETAYAGSVAGGGNAWWYYFVNTVEIDQPIYAGQMLVEGAYANYSNGVLTIELGPSMRLRNVSEAVKIQGYNAENLPSSRPPSGQFSTYKGNELIVEIPDYPYYVIHLDVEVYWNE